MTATATTVSPKRTSGRSTWRATSNARRASKLDRKLRQTNCSNIFRWYRSGWGRYTQRDPIIRQGRSTYEYADSRPLVAADPFGLYRIHGHEIGHTTVNDLNSANGCNAVTGGACSFVTPTIQPDCGCAAGSCGFFSPHAELDINVTIHFYIGSFANSGLPPAVDLDVVDGNSAVAHEFYAHLYPAAEAADQLLDAFNQTSYGDQQSCIVACVSRRAGALQTFTTTLQQTQAAENALGNQGQHRRWNH